MISRNSLFLIAVLTGIFTSGCKENAPLYNIEAVLHSIETSIEDPGIECELYGGIWSLPESRSQSAAHDHFQHSEDSHFEIGLNDSYTFSETPVSVKTWGALEESDVIHIRIKLYEDDTIGDDSFGDKTFKFPVAEILSEIDQATGYTEKSGLTVYSGTESISITFRFRIL